MRGFLLEYSCGLYFYAYRTYRDTHIKQYHSPRYLPGTTAVAYCWYHLAWYTAIYIPGTKYIIYGKDASRIDSLRQREKGTMKKSPKPVIYTAGRPGGVQVAGYPRACYRLIA